MRAFAGLVERLASLLGLFTAEALAIVYASWDGVMALISDSMYESREVTGRLLPPIVMLICVVGRVVARRFIGIWEIGGCSWLSSLKCILGCYVL